MQKVFVGHTETVVVFVVVVLGDMCCWWWVLMAICVVDGGTDAMAICDVVDGNSRELAAIRL